MKLWFHFIQPAITSSSITHISRIVEVDMFKHRAQDSLVSSFEHPMYVALDLRKHIFLKVCHWLELKLKFNF